MPDDSTALPRSFAPALATGAIQGVLLWWLSRSVAEASWPASHPIRYCVLLLVGVFLPPTILLLSAWQSRRVAWLLALAAAVLLTAAGAQQGLQFEPAQFSRLDGGYFPFTLLLATFVWMFHAIPFAQAYLITGRVRPAYALLFLCSWRNAVQLALAALFTGVFWVLLWLWIELFDMLKIHFPKVLFSENVQFSLLLAAMVFAAGFHLAGSAERLLTALRQQVLALLKWLALVATIILMLFAAALVVRSPELMASQRHLISASWLLWLALITVYLYNAAYQDGSTPRPYPPATAAILRYASPLLLLIALMALYALLVRAHAYGLTTSRVWGMLVAVLALGYAAGYTLSAFRSGPWMSAMGSTNIAVALTLLLLLGLTLSPVLAPERLSARSLTNRMLATPASVTSSDLMALRFDDGRYGRAALLRLAGAGDPLLAQGAKSALAVSSAIGRYQFLYPPRDASKLALRAFPTDAEIDSDLRAAIAFTIAPYEFDVWPKLTNESDDTASGADAADRQQSGPCPGSEPCPVLFIDLAGSGEPQAIAFWGRKSYVFQHVFQKTAGHWKAVGSLKANCHACSKADLLHHLEAGEYRALASKWKDLEIGNTVIVITDRP